MSSQDAGASQRLRIQFAFVEQLGGKGTDFRMQPPGFRKKETHIAGDGFSLAQEMA